MATQLLRNSDRKKILRLLIQAKNLMICKVEKRKSKQKTNNKYLQKVAAQEYLIYHIIVDWDLLSLVNKYLAICFFKGVRKYLKLIPVLICWFFKLVFLSISNLIFTVCVAFKIQVRNRQKSSSFNLIQLDFSNLIYQISPKDSCIYRE